MQILAPAHSVREADVLISCGAQELYCGLHPAAWTRRHGKKVWLNRRGAGNVESFAELKELTGVAHARGVPVHLTLNLPFYPPEHYTDVLDMAERATVEGGVDALIIADPGMIVAVKRSRPDIAVHVSSLAAVLNSEAVKFFAGLGASRIIFPRYIPLANLRRVTAEAGNSLGYEVFILNDGCMFEEGYCHASHTFGGAFCSAPRNYRLVRTPEAQEKQESFAHHLADYRRWIWCVGWNCGGLPGPQGYPDGMCGICALPELQEMGVTTLKIIGREGSLGKKAASVRLVRRVLDLVESGTGPAEVKKRARAIRGTPGGCDSGYLCYFR